MSSSARTLSKGCQEREIAVIADNPSYFMLDLARFNYHPPTC